MQPSGFITSTIIRSTPKRIKHLIPLNLLVNQSIRSLSQSIFSHSFSQSLYSHYRFRSNLSTRGNTTEILSHGGIFFHNGGKDALFATLRACRSEKGRLKQNLFCIEQAWSILEALDAQLQLHALVMTETAFNYQKKYLINHQSQLDQFDPIFGPIPLDAFDQGQVPIHIIRDHLMKEIYHSDCPHLVAIAHLPSSHELDTFSSFKRIILLDQILQPRNIGLILRTAEAFKIQGILITSGTSRAISSSETREDANDSRKGSIGTDGSNDAEQGMYSRLAIKASRGAVFRLPFLFVEKEKVVDFVKRNEFKLICSTSKTLEGSQLQGKQGKQRKRKKEEKQEKQEKKEDCIKLGGKEILVLGNESQGVSPIFIKQASYLMNIPIQTESLNVVVAAGIMLHQLYSRNMVIKEIRNPIQSKESSLN